MTKINTLTPAQWADLATYREECRAAALRPHFASDDEMRQAVRDLYKSAGLSEPTVWVFSDPVQCLWARAILRGQLWDQLGGQLWDQLRGQLRGQLRDQLRDQLRGQLRDQLRDQLGDQLRGQLGGQLRGQLGDQLWDQLRGQLGDQLRGQLGGQLRDKLGDQLRGQLRGQLWDQLGDQLGGQLGGQLWDQLGGQLWDQLRGQLGDQLRGQLGGQLRDKLGDQLRGQLRGQLGGQLGGQLWDQLGGQLRGQLRDQLGDQLSGQSSRVYDTLWFAGGSEFYWVSFYRFCESAGVRFTEPQSKWLSAWENYAQACGPLYPYEGHAFVSRRPETLRFDDQQRLHSETGAAMAFPSGYAIYAWHGVRVPHEWIEGRDALDPATVLACENVEQRAAGMEIVGWAKALDLLECKVIDSDPDPDHGDLIELTLPGLNEPGRFLRAYCPRNGLIVEGCPRISDIDGKPINTVKAAQAWSFGVAEADFTYPEAVS